MILQVGVKLLIKDSQGKYLFLKRSASYKTGSQPWDIPGGRINPDEPILEALTREIAEETGMTLTSDPTLIAAQDIFASEKDLHVVRLTYKGDAVGEINVSDEHSEYEWLTIEEVLTQHVDSYLKDVLKELL